MNQNYFMNPLFVMGQNIYQQTGGMCVMAPAPGGIGLRNPEASEIRLALVFNPELTPGPAFPENVEDYDISIAAFRKSDGKPMTAQELEECMQNGENAATRTIAKAAYNLSGMSMLLSRETCRQLYDVLVDLMLEQPDIPQTGPSMG